MTVKRRIIEETYQGMTRYNVQYKVLFWWVTNPPFHIGNNHVDKYNGFGYYDIEGAKSCLARCIALDYVGQKVVV